MLRNYRSLGATNSSYLGALGSGASQGGGGGGSQVCIVIKDTIKLTMLPLLKEKEGK